MRAGKGSSLTCLLQKDKHTHKLLSAHISNHTRVFTYKLHKSYVHARVGVRADAHRVFLIACGYN